MSPSPQPPNRWSPSQQYLFSGSMCVGFLITCLTFAVSQSDRFGYQPSTPAPESRNVALTRLPPSMDGERTREPRAARPRVAVVRNPQ